MFLRATQWQAATTTASSPHFFHWYPQIPLPIRKFHWSWINSLQKTPLIRSRRDIDFSALSRLSATNNKPEHFFFWVSLILGGDRASGYSLMEKGILLLLLFATVVSSFSSPDDAFSVRVPFCATRSAKDYILGFQYQICPVSWDSGDELADRPHFVAVTEVRRRKFSIFTPRNYAINWNRELRSPLFNFLVFGFDSNISWILCWSFGFLYRKNSVFVSYEC